MGKVDTSDWLEWTSKVASWQDITKSVPRLVRDDIAKGRMKIEDPARGIKALMHDPLSIQYAMGYKDRKYSLTYDVLKRIPHQLSFIGGILNTRVNQVAAFSTPFRSSKSVGFVVKHKDPSHLTSKSEQKFIKDLETFIYNCGSSEPNPHNKKKRDGFETFLKKAVRDTLTLDQFCVEIVPDRRGQPYEFIAIDASTIRIAANNSVYGPNETYHSRTPAYSGRLLQHMLDQERGPYRSMQLYDRGSKNAAEYVQIINGQIENVYTEEELAFGIRNPRTDIYIQGYGYCLHPDTRVETAEGLIKISDLDQKNFQVVIDGKLQQATAFKTGKKEVFEVSFEDGRVVRASKDHKFYKLNDQGFFDWFTLADIREGDYLASSCNSFEIEQSPDSFSFDYTPTKKEHCYPLKIDYIDEDICELLGWLVGDGNIHRKGSSYSIALFYEKNKEKSILDRHKATLDKMGVHNSVYSYEDSAIYELKFSNKPFGLWLENVLGFIPSNTMCKPGCLPEFVFRLNKLNRRAFLRGLFSADGSLGNSDTPFLGCTDAGLLADTQKLLWSLGIRSRWYDDQVEKDFGKGETFYDAGKLYIYDKVAFFDTIGFLQQHKAPILESYQDTRIDVVDESFARQIAVDIRETCKAGTSEYRRCTGLIQNPPAWGVTRDWLSKNTSDQRILDSLSWHHSKVLSVRSLNVTSEIYDVSVDSSFHGFCVEGGVVVHNSELEQLITIITSHLYAEEYNRRFFMQGCVAGDTPVYTSTGIIPIQKLVGSKFKVWNGLEFVEADAVCSGEKLSVNTLLQNDKILTTSPDHKFLTFNNSGTCVMVPINQLSPGDFVAQADELVEFDPLEDTLVQRSIFHQSPTVDAGILDEEFYEFIGFLVGDGYISNRPQSKYTKKCSYVVSCVFGPKDTEVKQKFISMLIQRGISHHMRKSGGQCGGTPIDCLTIRNKGVFEFLQGVVGVSEKKAHQKSIPTRLFKESTKNRGAFLRGLFSADGFVKKGYQAHFCSSSRELVSGVQDLLWSLGIHSSLSYTLRNTSGRNCYYLRVTNNRTFLSRVGFIQTYKQQNPRKADSLGFVPRSLQKALYMSLYGKELPQKRWLTRRDLQRLEKNNNKNFEALRYRWTRIDEIVPTGVQIPMYDIRQEHHKHQWSTGGCIVSNSAPKGLLNFKGDSMTPDMLEGFRRQWKSSLEGVSQSWRTPILQSEAGIEWIDLHPTNREMEYNAWIEYLIKVSCFTGDTLVTMKDGSSRRIDLVSPGEEVLTGGAVPRKISNIQVTDYTGDLLTVHVGGRSTGVTPEHPFYVCTPARTRTGKDFDQAEYSWVRAENLLSGDYLVFSQYTWAEHAVNCANGGSLIPIDKIELEEGWVGKVYNLEVNKHCSSISEGAFESTYQANGATVHNCAVFQIDPAEVNFDMHGGVQQTPLFESSQEWKLKASRDKGLKPLLRFLAKMINDHIISKIDDHFVFDFVGLDELTDQEKHTLRTEQVSSYLTLNEVRREDDLDDLEYGDIPLNPTYLQAMQIKMQMEQQKQQMEQQKQASQASGAGEQGGAGEGGAPGAGAEAQEEPSPDYSDRFTKSLRAKEGSKFLEIDLDSWIGTVRGDES